MPSKLILHDFPTSFVPKRPNSPKKKRDVPCSPCHDRSFLALLSGPNTRPGHAHRRPAPPVVQHRPLPHFRPRAVFPSSNVSTTSTTSTTSSLSHPQPARATAVMAVQKEEFLHLARPVVPSVAASYSASVAPLTVAIQPQVRRPRGLLWRYRRLSLSSPPYRDRILTPPRPSFRFLTMPCGERRPRRSRPA